eukprot:UN00286
MMSPEFTVDKARFGSIFSFGLLFYGPVGGLWYKHLDSFVTRRWAKEHHAKQVFRKVVLEQIFLAPVYTFAFFFFSQFGSQEGFQSKEFSQKLKQDFVSTLLLDQAAWCCVSPILYGFVPVKQQLLVASALAALEATAFSYIAFNSVESIPVIGPVLTKLLSSHSPAPAPAPQNNIQQNQQSITMKAEYDKTTV